MNDEDSLPPPDCEREDAHPAVAAVLAGSLAAIVAVCILGGYLVAGHAGNRGPGLPGADGIFQNGTHERTDIDRAWDTIHQQAGTVADSYAWIDRPAGIVQIPIDRAIDLVCAGQKPTAAAPGRRNFP
jgi:hypothetical protein